VFLFRPGAYLQGLFPVTDSFVDTDEPGVNEMSLTPVPPQPFDATELTTNARPSAVAGWIPLPVALLVPLPAMSEPRGIVRRAKIRIRRLSGGRETFGGLS
jgi:hypothetical protein